MFTRRGVSPAQAILDQFDKAAAEIDQDPNKILIWAPILEQLGPSLIVQSENAKELGEGMVKDFLRRYMFKNEDKATEKAQEIVKFFSNHNYFKSHGRRVGIDALKRRGVKVKNLRDDPEFHKAVLELFCAIDLTFANTNAVRLIENHFGIAIVKSFTPLR